MFPPLHPSIVRNVIYPIYRGLRGDELLPMLEELERTQWLTAGEIEELQWRKLHNLLVSAATFVPYYRELFAGIGMDAGSVDTIEDFRRIPPLTRERIEEAGRSVITGDPLRKGLPASTGGSTKDFPDFYADLSASPLKRANTLRGYRWAGVDVGERQAYLWRINPERPLKERLRNGFKNYFNNILYLSTFDMSDEALTRYAGALRRYRPDILIGYPSALELFVQFCARTGERGPRPRAVVTSGEMLLLRQRERIEGYFSCPLFDRYGIREFGDIAHECEKHDGMHLFADLFHVEILDKGGNPVKPGEAGELVVTDLSNYYMPFIRYRTGDLALQTDRICSCGRGLPILERIEGRPSKAAPAPSGQSRFVDSNAEDRLVVKSKIHKAMITGEESDAFDCLRVDEKLMELSNIIPGEKVLIVDNTNGARVETFACTGLRGSGEIVACGAVSKHIHSGDEVSIMSFAWSDGSKGGFKNILVDRHNNFVRYLTEVAGEML
jgi:phenylacetate-CoA ligase